MNDVPAPIRILVADDDADVLHALRLLLRGEGYEVETATSPAGVLAAVEASDFDAALLDLNYARDTTSGREGIELRRAPARARPDPAGDRHDRVGQRRGRGRGGAERRPRLHREAVEQRAAARHAAQPARALPRAAAGAAARAREPPAPPRRASRDDRRVARDAPGARADRARRPERGERAGHRRARHRQGAGRAHPPRRLAARARAPW